MQIFETNTRLLYLLKQMHDFCANYLSETMAAIRLSMRELVPATVCLPLPRDPRLSTYNFRGNIWAMDYVWYIKL